MDVQGRAFSQDPLIEVAHYNQFLYLAAVMDWYSRYELAWRLSNTLEWHFPARGIILIDNRVTTAPPGPPLQGEC